MSTITKTQANGKAPRKKPARFIGWWKGLRAPNSCCGAILIRMDGEVTYYFLREEEDHGLGDRGRCFQLSKLDPRPEHQESYHTCISGKPAECSCECKGFLRWSKCKHVEGLLAMNADGRLD